MTPRIVPLALALLAIAGTAAAKDHRGPTSRLFISPMGEPFRSNLDGDPEAAWLAGADANHDGRLSLAEFQADAARWFTALDRGGKGEIDPDDIERYENELVPEIRVADAPRSRASATDPPKRRGSGGRGGPGGGGRMGSGGMGGPGGGSRRGKRQDGGGSDAAAGRPAAASATRQGAARYSYLDYPEPLTAADANLNRGIDRVEMANAAAQRFALLDKNSDGFLDKRELPRVDTRSNVAGPRHGSLGDQQRGDQPPHDDRDRQLGGGDREQD